MEVEPLKGEKPTIPTGETKKGLPDKIITTDDFLKAYAVQQSAMMDLIDKHMKENVIKLLKIEYKVEVKDWKLWHGLLFAYATAVKQAFSDANEEVCSKAVSEQLLFLAKLFRKEEEKEKTKK